MFGTGTNNRKDRALREVWLQQQCHEECGRKLLGKIRRHACAVLRHH